MDYVEIYELYITTNNGVAVWYLTDPHNAAKIFHLAPRIRDDNFQVRTYIPDIARAQK